MDIGINSRIKEIRTELGYTQQKFAEQIGISRAHCANIENARVTPTDSIIRLIAFKFNTNYEWLVSGNGSRVSGFTEETRNGLTEKYNSMRIIFEKILSDSDDGNLKNMVLSFSFFVSVFSAASSLPPEGSKIYYENMQNFFDEFEKLTFRFSHNKGKSHDYKIQYEILEAIDEFVDKEKVILKSTKELFNTQDE